MDKFVNSPLDGEHDNTYHSDYISDLSPAPKRCKADQPCPKKRISVEEYTKRKEREHKREQERRDKERKQKLREREMESRKDRAKDKKRRMAEEDNNPKASISNPQGECSSSEIDITISNDIVKKDRNPR